MIAMQKRALHNGWSGNLCVSNTPASALSACCVFEAQRKPETLCSWGISCQTAVQILPQQA